MQSKRYCDVFTTDRIARAEYESTLNPANTSVERKMVEAIPKDVESVLDYGCGTGRLSKYWGDYTGYDVSESMLNMARKNRGEKNFTSKLPERLFDAVIFDAILSHYTVPEIKEMLDKVKNLADRYIVIFDWDTEGKEKTIGSEYGTVSHFYNQRRWLSLLRTYGKVIRTRIDEDGGRILYLVKRKVYPDNFNEIFNHIQKLQKIDAPYPDRYRGIDSEIKRVRQCPMYFTRGWEYPWAVINSGLKRNMDVLDLGSGMQSFGIYLSTIGMNVVAQDNIDPYHRLISSTHTIENFREFYSNSGVTFIPADIINIPYKDGCFDRIFCISLFDHVTFEEFKKGVPEITRVLKKDGLLILTMDKYITGCKYPKFGQGFTKRQLKKEENFSVIYRNELKRNKKLRFMCESDVYKGIIIGEIYQKK